jgi:hypothetical protein
MEHIHNFKAFVLNESEEPVNNIIIETYKKILSQLTNLSELDTLTELVEGNHFFDGIIENRELISKAYNEVYLNLVPAWISKLEANNRLRSGENSIDDVYAYSETFKKWISDKGYDSNYEFLSYIPGSSGLEYTEIGEEEGTGSFPQVDLDNLDQSINKIVSAIKGNEVYGYYRGYFRMGFDVFPREKSREDIDSEVEEEKPGCALFAFKDFSTKSKIEEADKTKFYSLSPESEYPYTPSTYFLPNTSLFYDFNPGPPYGTGREGITRNPMVDFCDEEGYIVFSKRS